MQLLLFLFYKGSRVHRKFYIWQPFPSTSGNSLECHVLLSKHVISQQRTATDHSRARKGHWCVTERVRWGMHTAYVFCILLSFGLLSGRDQKFEDSEKVIKMNETLFHSRNSKSSLLQEQDLCKDLLSVFPFTQQASRYEFQQIMFPKEWRKEYWESTEFPFVFILFIYFAPNM